MKKENENRGSYDSPKWGKHPKETRKTHCVMVRFDDEEWLKFLSMYDQSGVYARAVFIKARVFSQPFRVIKTERAAAPDSSNIERKRTCSSALKRTV